MAPVRQKWFVRLALAVGVAGGLAWLAAIDFKHKVSTDILDLIPAAERAPELALARRLASEQQARVAMFAVRAADESRREQAADVFAARLRASEALAEVLRMPDTTERQALGRHLFERRFDLLLPGWLAAREAEHAPAGSGTSWPEWLAERTAAGLERFLAEPEAIAFQDIIPADPLGLMAEFVDRTRGLEDPAAAAGEYDLIWARTSGAPLTEAGQQPVFSAVEEAAAAARAVDPGFRLEWTSIGRFAAENRRRIEQEMSWLNLGSLVAVLGVAALCLQHVTKVVQLVPVVLGALLGAWVVTTAAFDRVHVLVFVIGSLLGGVAIDYGFYLFLQPPLYPFEPYTAKVRRLLRPLAASALTTVLGFSLLLRSELPLIRQLGVFVSAGLVAALAAALLWFGQRDETFTRTRAFARARLTGNPGVRFAARALLALLALVAVAGTWRLEWHDDIRELEALPPGFREEALAVRALFGDSTQRAAYLTRGDTVEEARASLARFLDWHARQFPGTALASLGLALPTLAEWESLPGRVERLAGFERALPAALARHGFDPDAFAPFFSAWTEWRAAPRPEYRAVIREFHAVLRGPVALTMSITPAETWFVSIAEHPPGAEPPRELATMAIEQLQSLNRLFSRYRASALELSALGFGFLGASVLVLYGVRRGAGVFAVPLGACFFAMGALGLAGQTLNLFHLLGAFLGVCLSHNYAIFTAENAGRGEEPPPSIRLSALTTGASFGVLAFSRIPVVAALGVTVALIVMTALTLVELLPLAWPAAANLRRAAQT